MERRKKHALSVGILAGGKSTRMGQNKALMQFQNETMIERISRRLSGLGEVLVSASERGLYEAPGIRVVYDENNSIGPIEGIRRLLLAADTEYVFVCAADMPFVDREIVEYLEEYISSDYDCYVVTDEDHVHPLCAIYSKRILPVIEELIRQKKFRLMELLNRVRTKYVSLEYTHFDKRIVRNVNTKNEFLALSLPVVFAVSGYKNSGKTWLIEKLINEFIKEGYSVGVLKHDGQDHITVAEGTDTHRHQKAGAVVTAVTSESGYVFESRRAETPEFLMEKLKCLPEPPDIILLEGFKHSEYPKVEVVRRAAVPESAADPSTLICISTDCLSPEHVSCPLYGTDDIQGIFSCVKHYFGLPDKGRTIGEETK
ncbi:MAG: molybdopterin-guanine dinucleotide biosynthesis protein B [Eubacterium sp.]|nr:molybdopterin-guanine dinucleotide biosynthesis protein B [Eubacterium sp.]